MKIEFIKKCCIFDKNISYLWEKVSMSNHDCNAIETAVNLVGMLRNMDQKLLDAPDYKRDENIHRLFLYPAMMIPPAQKAILDIITRFLPENSNMIDPFMGASTSLLPCMELGLNVYGQDINPFAVLLSKVKTGPLDSVLFGKRSEVIQSRIEKDISEEVAIPFSNIDKWFKKNIQIELSRIRRAIMSEENIHVRRFFWVVMAETIRLTSNDRTSTFKLHQRSQEDIKKRNISAKEEFLKLSQRSIDDIEKFKNKLEKLSLIEEKQKNYKGTAHVKWGNTMEEINSSSTFSLLVSSPPYGDNQTTVTYGQHSYLPLQWIDGKDIDEHIDYDYLRTTQEIDRKSLGGKIDQQSIAYQWQIMLDKSEHLKSFVHRFEEKDHIKLNKVIAFIYDFYRCLDVILPKLNKDAFLIWTIGNRHVAKKEVPNDKILIDLMEDRHISLIYEAERVISNKIMPSRNKTTKTMTKEKILIFQKTY